MTACCRLQACQVPPTILPWLLEQSCMSVYAGMFACVSVQYMHHLSLQFGLFLASLPLSPCSTAFVLDSIMPLLQSGVGKRESGNFIIITSHFCNLYAMRTLCACSYNQVCRNHVRCFTNSWGDGSSSGSDAFPCCSIFLQRSPPHPKSPPHPLVRFSTVFRKKRGFKKAKGMEEWKKVLLIGH